MLIKVMLFAAAKEVAGTGQLEIELPAGARMGDLKVAIVRTVPELEALVAKSAFSIDQQYATDDDLLSQESEFALIPPVSGG